MALDADISKRAKEYKEQLAFSRFLKDDVILGDDFENNEEEDKKKFEALAKSVKRRSYVIAIIVGIIIFGEPIFKPLHTYFAMNYDRAKMQLVPLSGPNMTREAILSWTANTITEVMTLGFGDFDRQLIAQRGKFTDLGWKSFIIAMRDGGLRDKFKQQQLILTTVPSDMPVIVGEGEDKDQIYTWMVEMPVIMTFSTNNNVTSKTKAIIKLTITRVPSKQSIGGIAIKAWNVS